jgi:hypothetical protein
VTDTAWRAPVLHQPAKMNPSVKEVWLSGLRSGRYPQGDGALHRDSRFCCLGVLCAVAVDSGLPVSVERDQLNSLFTTYYDSASQYLPGSVVEWAGLDGEDPAVWIDQEIVDQWAEDGDYMDMPFALHQTTSLSDLNDNGVPFPLIAGLIERQL